jgi:hypothetical protein
MRVQQPQSISMPRQSRPKLCLNTSQTRTFGKGSSLRLETLSAVSPTVINTFSNAYEPEQTPATVTGRPTRPRLSIDSAIPSTTGDLDSAEALDSRTPSSSSVSSASTLNSATIPYSISQVLNSILANTPLQPRANIRRMSLRPRFPVEKKVSFRTPLVEEIVNTKYTVADSDLIPSDFSDNGSSISFSSEDADSEPASNSSSSSIVESNAESTLSLEQATNTSQSKLLPKASESARVYPIRRRRPPPRIKSKTDYPRTGDKRDSSSESDSDVCPETPVAGRRKKQRQWVWTLGSLPEQSTNRSIFDDTTSTSTMTTDSTSSFASTHASSESS